MKANFAGITVDAQILYQSLVSVNVGETVTYSHLTQLIGRSVRAGAPGCSALKTARHLAQREDRIVFGVDRGNGLVRLADAGIVTAGCAGLAKIRRQTRRSSKLLSCVAEFDALPNATKIQHNAALSIYGALAQATKPSTVRAVQASDNVAACAIPLAKTLGMFI